MVASIVFHAVLLGLVLLLPAALTDAAKPKPVEVVFYSPAEAPELPEIPPPQMKAPPPPKPRPEPKVHKPQVARVERPKPEPVLPVRVEPPRERRPDPRPAAPAPHREVRTHVFKQAESTTVAKATPPERRTRTGSFADTPRSAPERAVRTRAATQVGGFQVAASEPSTPARPAVKERTVARADFGETVAAIPAVKHSAQPRAVVRGGFGSSDAAEAPVRPARKGKVTQGSFGDGAKAAQPPRPKPKAAANPDTPVEILSKPRPIYTAEARELRVEGEVVLEVVFVASGQLRILGVESSLGHGLDEAAIEAAKKIQFKPARRDGRPVDHRAVLRIVFQLA